jgi:hypothetical protein
VKTFAFLTALGLLAILALGVVGGFVYTIAHATARVLDTLGGF